MDPQDKAEQATVAKMRAYRLQTAGGPLRVLRGEFHRHSEISMDGGNDGTIIDQYRYMLDASYMDWVGCCDHDNGAGREYTWWISQKLTDIFYNTREVRDHVPLRAQRAVSGRASQRDLRAARHSRLCRGCSARRRRLW